MDFDPERIASSPFAIGGIGALIAAVKSTPGASFKERAFNVLAGAASAGFATPALIEWMGLKSQAYSSGLAFTCGLVGMSLTAAVLNGIKDVPVGQILTGWLSRGDAKPKE